MAKNTLPDPLVPADCDCTDLDGFMLNTERLMGSEFIAVAQHEEIAAALMLWCRAWKQRPAASLPDDEKVLAAFARMPIQRFRKLREAILHGFVKCSDGRIYHRVLAEEAIRAFEKKKAFRRKRETDAERLRKWRSERSRNANETTDETRFVAEGQGQGQVFKYPPTPRKRGRVHGFPPGFDAFWAAYPRKVAKEAAAKAFARTRPDEATLTMMLSAIRRQAASPAWQKDRGEFVPHAATWLNGRRWEDAETPGVTVAADPCAGAL